jgi:hypothetical protein
MDTDPYRILGVPPNATDKRIRQAYLDLARVWHPDRFQSDPRLQQVAQDQLRQINEAYTAIKGRQFRQPDASSSGPGTHRPAANNPRRRRPPIEWTVPRFPSDLVRRLLRGVDFSGVILRMGVALACFVPVLFAVRLLPLLRVPVLDIDMIAHQARIVRPQILTPARILDPLSDIRSAADVLEEWARGEVMDLWKPASWNPGRASMTISRNISSTPQPDGGRVKQVSRRALPDAGRSDLANGAELIGGGPSSGAGELRLVNNTDLEEIATLLRQRVALRMVYVKPNHEVLLRSLSTGLYEVHLEFGNRLDLQRQQFRQNRRTMNPVGPFEFFEVTTAGGTAGQHYEVVVSPP